MARARRKLSVLPSWLLELLIALVVVIVDPCSGRAAPQNNRLAKPLIEEGITAYQEGNYQEAIVALTKAQTLVPDHSPTALYLGLAYLKQNRLLEAIAAWQTYVTLPPYTTTERQNNLQATVTQYLTLLLRAENQQNAKAAIARERDIGPGDAHSVAITYYQNLGSAQLTPLQKGLTALLIVDVSQVRELKVVERDRLQAMLEELKLGTSGMVDQRTAARTGHLLGAGQVATGSYLDPTKDQMRVDSVLAATSSAKVVGNEDVSGQIKQFFDVEKELASAILKDLGYDQNRLQGEGVLDAVRRPHTTSYPAFESFSLGLDAKDRQDYGTARSLFQQALTYDPKFEAARRELLHTPLAPLSIGEISSSVAAAAPSAAEATVGMPELVPALSPPHPVVEVPPVPPVMVAAPPPPPAPPPAPPPIPPPPIPPPSS
jgi:tetratricopeptide (TPR) repeat protein